MDEESQMEAAPDATVQRRKRDPESTRIAILEAAKTVLARDGVEGLSVSSVAKLAGVNRGTAYQHFQVKEDLVRATLDWVSHQLLESLFDQALLDGENRLRIDQAALEQRPDVVGDMVTFNNRLAEYAIENPDICRIWLYDVLSRDNPKEDVFYKNFEEAIRDLAAVGALEQGMDTEVHAVLMLAGFFLWPVWVRSHAKGRKSRQQMAERFASEVTRLSMHGVFRDRGRAGLKRVAEAQ